MGRASGGEGEIRLRRRGCPKTRRGCRRTRRNSALRVIQAQGKFDSKTPIKKWKNKAEKLNFYKKNGVEFWPEIQNLAPELCGKSALLCGTKAAAVPPVPNRRATRPEPPYHPKAKEEEEEDDEGEKTSSFVKHHESFLLLFVIFLSTLNDF